MHTRKLILPIATTLAIASFAMAEQPTTAPADLPGEISALRARIDQPEAKHSEDVRRSQETQLKLDEQITSDELARDARRHDQLLTSEGFTAGYSDNRFVVQSEDGDFLLRPWAHFQFRGVSLDRHGFQGTAKHPDDEVDSGFEVRQLRVGVDGNMFSPDLTYFFNWATQRTSTGVTVKNSSGAAIGTVSNSLGGGLVLQQAWVKYRILSTPFFLKAGEIKDPVLHEQIVDTRFQQIAERSISADIFVNGDAFTEAATVVYDPNTDIRAEGGVNHGMRGANTNFLDYPNNGGFNAFNYGLAGRVEYKAMGRWKDYYQVGGVGTPEPLLVFGSGADYSERGRAGQLVGVGDVMYVNPGGFNCYGEVLDRYTTHNFGYYIQSPSGANINAGDPAVAGRATNEYALVAQTGYLINGHWEPFFRYEYMHLQGTPAGSHNWIQAVTGGANYYFSAHRMKLTGEIIYLPQGLPFDDTSSDVLTNSNGKIELSFIIQLQLLL